MHHQQIIKFECHSVAYLICKIGPNKQFLLDYLRVKKSPELLLDSIYPLQKTKYKGFQISSSPDTSRRWGLVWNTLSYARKGSSKSSLFWSLITKRASEILSTTISKRRTSIRQSSFESSYAIDFFIVGTSGSPRLIKRNLSRNL